MIIMKNDLSTFNETIFKVQSNENSLIQQVTDYTTALQKEFLEKDQEIRIIQVMNILMRLLSACVTQLYYNIQLLFDVLIHAQSGVIQPQMLSMKTVRNELEKVKAPGELILPFSNKQAGKAWDISLVIDKYILMYIVKVPIMKNALYTLYNILNLPVSTDIPHIYQTLFTEQSYLLMEPSYAWYGWLSCLLAIVKV